MRGEMCVRRSGADATQPTPARRLKKVLNLALQGGGSHGAFTWGVLDRLLEDERVEIEGVSGASAGALNAALLAYGLTAGGPQAARRALASFWTGVASSAPSPLVESLVFLARFLSPQQFNPLNLNPLRDILLQSIDFDRLRAYCKLELFVSATHVKTGKPRIFRTHEITAEVLLASACLPWMHRAIEIDGDAYWDGGLTANPPVRSLLYECEARDIVLVLLQPSQISGLPASVEDIWARMTEMGFSSALYAELEGIALAKREAQRSFLLFGRLERKLRRLRLHHLRAPSAASTHSRFNTRSVFMQALFEAGRKEAEDWLTRFLAPAASLRGATTALAASASDVTR